ncbi:reverse transcriptase domain-containing protein [Cupriavidus pinatubonensis]|uniref:reverse transcriptase domain-containing protein n=1 Tax=Cupriavidus pinatubonensis TaxID=248026 RepID=UPI001125CE03|nr:hypothetical protein C2U69_09680 [Cupriavidus pinatubonensis]
MLEADIRSCFDEISHDWLVANIPTDKAILQKWLKAGYLHNRVLHSTQAGTPQGGIVSPALMNMTLGCFAGVPGAESMTSRRPGWRAPWHH